jgi:DNA-binding NtrC family response regulator
MEMIYLIDDDEIQNLVNAKILSLLNLDLNVEEFTNAKLALDKIIESKKFPNIILLDINMPKMNGWEFLDLFEGINTNSDVYLLTSSINENDMKKSQNYNSVKAFLTKPLHLDKAKEVVETSYSH